MNPIDSFFRINNYSELLDKSLTTKKSPDDVKASVKKLYEQITETHSNIHIQGEADFCSEIQSCIYQILEHKPGRKLFKWILKNPHQLTIRFNEESCQDQENVYINHHEQFRRNIINTDGKISECILDRFIILAHEIIHYVHYCMDKEAYEQNELEIYDLIYPRLDDLEEQRTMCGIIKDSAGNYIFEIFCENVFMRAVSSHLTCFHSFYDSEKPSLVAAAYFGLEHETQQILLKHPEQLHQIGITGYEDGVVYPLTAAVLSGNASLVKSFLDSGADATVTDLAGGPLYTAIDLFNPELVEILIEHGADPCVEKGNISAIFRAFSRLNHNISPSQKQTINDIIKLISTKETLLSSCTAVPEPIQQYFPLSNFDDHPDLRDFLTPLYEL